MIGLTTELLDTLTRVILPLLVRGCVQRALFVTALFLRHLSRQRGGGGRRSVKGIIERKLEDAGVCRVDELQRVVPLDLR